MSCGTIPLNGIFVYMNILIDLFDHSGHAAEPYRKNGWHVIQVDIKHGIDILTWDYKNEILKAVMDNWVYSTGPQIGILAAIPCTDYATSGAKHFTKKDANGETAKSQLLVDKTYDIIQFVKEHWSLMFWKIENPRTRIHTLNPWIGKITQKFNPCDFAGYIPISECLIEQFIYMSKFDISEATKQDIQLVMEANLYNKETWLFGRFNQLQAKRVNPVWKDNPGFRLYGGKSERTKELRSIDPRGYCLAFYEANH